MTIIKIEPNENGGHENNTIHGAGPAAFSVPDGWAIVPEEVGTPETLENFPFGDIVVDDGAPPMVTEWIPGVKPPPEPEPEPKPTAEERLAAVESAVLAMMMGG